MSLADKLRGFFSPLCLTAAQRSAVELARAWELELHACPPDMTWAEREALAERAKREGISSRTSAIDILRQLVRNEWERYLTDQVKP